MTRRDNGDTTADEHEGDNAPQPLTPLHIRPLRGSDLEAVARIERQSFLTPWNTQAYVTEIANLNAVYLVALADGVLVAYGGLWVIMDEAHITTIAVDVDRRGAKIGERLLVQMLTAAHQKGATRVTLEVRANNDAARRLYEKYGFVWVAVRKGYYSDNNENADILWINNLDDPEWRRRFAKNRAALGLNAQ